MSGGAAYYNINLVLVFFFIVFNFKLLYWQSNNDYV